MAGTETHEGPAPSHGQPAAASGPPAHPRRSGIAGLLRGLLQRLRNWGRGLLGVGPVLPGQQLLVLKRIRQGALFGVGAKVVLASRRSWRQVSKEPLSALLGYLRPWKATFGLMATGALCNVVLLYCQLRYHETDLSVVPPETRWQQALRALFGARPPAAGAPAPRRRSPPHSPRMPAIDEEKPSGSAAGAAGEVGEAAGPAAAGSPAAAGALPPGSPALSFVDIAASSPARPAAAAQQEWSEVPLGSTQPPSSAEDWMEVGHSGSGSPQLGGSPHAVDAPDPEFGEAAAAGAGAQEAAAGQEVGGGPGAQHTSSEQAAQDVASQ